MNGLSRPATIISAYAASPAHTVWDPELEGELLPALCALPTVAGLEVPWMGALHPHDTSWFSGTCRRARTCRSHRCHGSCSGARRCLPTGLPRQIPQGVRQRLPISGWFTPTCTRSLSTARHRSTSSPCTPHLMHRATKTHWWSPSLKSGPGAGVEHRLIIEHCDAIRPGQAYEKGFLRLQDEIDVLDEYPPTSDCGSIGDGRRSSCATPRRSPRRSGLPRRADTSADSPSRERRTRTARTARRGLTPIHQSLRPTPLRHRS